MSNIKVIGTASEMSNLVGMYAVLLNSESVISAKIIITGKADNRYFICQVISPFDGNGNVCKLMTLDELRNWHIIPTKELFNEILNDYRKNGWRYSIPF